MKRRQIKENLEKTLNDDLRNKPFVTLHDLLCGLHKDYNSCMAGNLEGEPNKFQERFVRLCRHNKLDFGAGWDKLENKHDS